MSPANVRAIRVSLRLRSDKADHGRGQDWAGDVLPSPENRTGSLNVPGYRLFSAQLDVTLRNMSLHL